LNTPPVKQIEDQSSQSMTNQSYDEQGTPRATFATTMNYLRSPNFADRVREIVRRPPPGKLMDAIRIFFQVLRLASREDRLLLSSSWGSVHPELLASALIGLWPARARPSIYLLGCMWEPDMGLRGLSEKILVRLADRAVDRYIVQSTEEMTVFPEIWKVSPTKIRFCPFFFSFTEDELRAVEETPSGDHIFAGGNSLRDYEPLIRAAWCMPERKFIIATRLLDDRPDLPENVEARPVSHHEFVSLMYSSAATIVPIQPGLRRAAGQQTYLNAMWMGKPTIVTDTLGVRDHIRHKETGMIVDGTAAGYIDALDWIFNPHNRPAVDQMTIAARKDVEEKFSFDNHIDCLLKIMDEDCQ
jgi:hypothetical protein